MNSAPQLLWMCLWCGVATGCVAPMRTHHGGWVWPAPGLSHEGSAPAGAPVPKAEHVVQAGETLYSLSRRYNVPLERLVTHNQIVHPATVRVGTRLRFPTGPERAPETPAATPGAATTTEAKDVTLAKAATSNGAKEATLAKAAPPGKAAARPVAGAPPRAKPLKPNGVPAAASSLAAGQKVTTHGSTHGSAHPWERAPERTGLKWPTAGTVSSPFGNRLGRAHDGIDINAPLGSPVHAAADGEVVFSSSHRGYGNVVILRHPQGLMTIYAHHQKNMVKRGQRVRRGDTIAYVGATGKATVPHLHFEVRHRARPRDPMGFLPARGML